MPSSSAVCTAFAALAGGVAIGVLFGDKLKRLIKTTPTLPADAKEVPLSGDDKKDFLEVFKVRRLLEHAPRGTIGAAIARLRSQLLRRPANTTHTRLVRRRCSPRSWSRASLHTRSLLAPPSTFST